MATTSAKTKSPRPAASCSVPPGEPVPIIKGSHVYLIDGSGYIFRAFHALPPLTRPSDGLPVGAVHGFCAMLWKLLQDSKKSSGPTHLAVIFDAGEKTFRNEIYKDYKAHRPPLPEELIPQFSVIRDAVKAFNIACIEQDGYEADDLIATYAKATLAAGGDVTVVSSDKDLMQLVQPGLVMLDTMKNRTIGPDEVREKFGVPPDKVVDVQALAGDSTDNVPGVPGIGVKTAAELINEYGDLETLLARAGEIKQPKRRERLTEFALQARLSLDLVTLKDDVPITVPVEQFGVRDPEPESLLGFLREMEFSTLTKRIAEGLKVDGAAAGRAVGGIDHAGGNQAGQSAHDGAEAWRQSARARVGGDAAGRASCWQRTPPRRRRSIARSTRPSRSWRSSKPGSREARAAGRFAFDTETTSLDAMQAEFVGFSLAVAPGRACYVPLGHRVGAGSFDFGDGDLKQVPIREALAAAEAAAGGRLDPEDRAEPQIRLPGAAPARHRAGPARRHACCSPTRSMAAAASTAWTRWPSGTWGTPASPSPRCWSTRPAPRNPTRRLRRCRSTRRRSTPPRTRT